MNNQKPAFYFLLLLIAGTFVLVFSIFRPFIFAIILATAFAVVFQPFHEKMVGYARQRQGIAALLTTIVIVACILIPIIFLGMQIFQEAERSYSYLTNGNEKDYILDVIRGLVDNLRGKFPFMRDFSIDVDQYLKQGVGWLLQNLGSIFSNLAKIIVSSFIFLFALYYLLKDGERLKMAIIALSPLAEADNEAIIQKLEGTMASVIKGSLLIALIQGVLTAVGFTIFGVPNAFLWGSVAVIAALIPGIGTSLVLAPAIIFLFLSGGTFSAIGLIVWGIGAVGLIDNLLGPRLIGRGMQLHPFLVLLSVLGGIGFFGPLGFLFGPLVVSLFFVLIDIYTSFITKV
ncbi:MAG TPA: AI-2E family transporter, partial [Candidatus Brocadiales bacterium]|nr:AI-2E family transporter [Candidatus Brocadiales bacterium]